MRVEPERLTAAATSLLAAEGAPESTAAAVAESLVGADLRGHGSHGVLRLPYYADLVEAGVIDPTASPAVERATPALASIDGRNAYGQVVGREAVARLTERAGETGVAAVGLRRATHLGRVGEWAERTAAAGYCFASFVNSGGGGHTVAPAGSADRRLSTNPLTFAVPTFDALDHDLVLDLATSQVAHGKLRERAATGEPAPPGWTTDDAGEPVTDAAAFEAGAGALLPLGGRTAGYKGTGLAVIAELFAGIAGAAPVAGAVEPGQSNNAALFLAVDPLAFTDRAGVCDRVAALAAHLREADYATGPGPGAAATGERYRLPGAVEHETCARRREEGIPLDDRIVERLRGLGAERGVSVL